MKTLNNGICEALDVRENVKSWICNFYNSKKDRSKPIIAQVCVLIRRSSSKRTQILTKRQRKRPAFRQVATDPLISALIGIQLKQEKKMVS